MNYPIEYRNLEPDDLRAVCRVLGMTQSQMAGSLELGERTWRRYVSNTMLVPRSIEKACFWDLKQAGDQGNEAAAELLASFRDDGS